VTTTSILVAEKFEKRHDDVLAAIRKIECSEDFRARNFTASSYKSKQNKALPMFILTRDAFTMLVMSFTGARAAKFREDFINEFNIMEAILKQGRTPVLIPTYQKRIMSNPTKTCPDTHWSIFAESHSMMLFVEQNIGSVNEYDLVDGSIGIRWSKFREGKDWAMECSTYNHEYKDVRGTRPCKCYEYSELPHFKKWLREVYKPIHLYDYLATKYTRDKNPVMLDKVKELLPQLLLNDKAA
jgi:Rha family phage regulatory protein